jgi:hypothetical protein
MKLSFQAVCFLLTGAVYALPSALVERADPDMVPVTVIDLPTSAVTCGKFSKYLLLQHEYGN